MKYIKLTEDIKALAQAKFLELINSVSVVEADLTVKVNTKDLINPDDIEKPVVIVEELASNKLWSYVHLCEKEIGWHGTVERHGNNFYIKDVFLFPQTVTAATVTTDDNAYSTWILAQDDEVFNHMRFHGHSHVNMAVGASGTDLAYQHDLLRDVQDFYIFGIFNKKGLMNFCIYDVQTNILFEQNDIIVQDYCSEFDAVIEDEIDRFVSQPVTTTYQYSSLATHTPAATTANSKSCPPATQCTTTKKGGKNTNKDAATNTKKKPGRPKKVKCGYFQCMYKTTCGKCVGNCELNFDCDSCLSKAYCKSSDTIKKLGGK